MKIKNTTFPALAASLVACSMNASGAVVVAGWDTWTSGAAPAPNVVATGITATTSTSTASGGWAAGEGGTSAGRGSSADGTWGTFDGGGIGASTSTTLQADNLLTTNGRVSSEITFTITNGAATDLTLAAFHMDALRWRPNAQNAYELTVVSGDLTLGSVFSSGANGLANNGGASLDGRDLHDDLDIDMSGLDDNVLAVGESAVIRIDFTGGTGSGGGHHLFLDNVAFSGDFAPIPEPSSAVLFGLGAFAFVIRRRK